MRKRLNNLPFALLWLLLLQGHSAVGQMTTATISGTVKDATGAVVPGSRVTARNVETGISRNLSTDAQGRFQFPNLSVGRYEVQASLAGFQTSVRSGIGLTVGQEAVVNFTLQVGQVAERVEVTGEAPLVETANATITGMATEDTIRELPLNGRSFTDIVLLQTGTTLGRVDSGSLGQGDAFSGGAKISVSGARPGQNSYLLDGTDINDSRPAAPGGIGGRLLGVDAVREFRLLTNAYSAEYGRLSGGVLTAVTKSGTNQLHGTAFEFFRNDDLDARKWEDKARGTAVKPPFVRNQFGFTLGGPIRRDKTFFFGAFEALRDRLSQSGIIDVPTAEAKRGLLPQGGIPGNPVVSIPVHPRTQRWLAFYPDPNGPILDKGDGTGEHSFSGSQETNQDFFQIRGDHSFSSNHSMFARYTFDDSERLAPKTPLPDRTFSEARNQYLTVQFDSVLSPTTLNAFRFGMNLSPARDTIEYVKEFDLEFFSHVEGRRFDQGSRLAVDELTNIGLDRVPRGADFELFEWSDDLTLIRGAHTLRTGFIVKKIRSFEETFNDVGGSIEFEGRVSGPRTSGLWDFLNGAPSELELQWPGAEENREWNMKLFGAYIQDDFRLKPNLTLNLGVRWEFMTSPDETDGKCANIFKPEQVLPFSLATGDVGPNALPGAPLGSVKCPFFETFKDNIAPRVGFAWDTMSDAKLVVRGGFGMFYDQPFPNFWKAAGRCCPPFAIETTVQPPFPFAKADTFLDFSKPPTDPIDVRSYDYSGTTYLMQYNLNIQSQIRPGTAVTLGYLGSQGRKLVITRQLNTIPRTIENGQVKFVQFPTFRQNLLSNPFAQSILIGGTQGSSSYNALVVSADHRFGGGLRAQLAYTFSKVLSHGDTVFGADFGGGLNSTGLMDGFDIGRDWGKANFDVTHVLSVNYTYDLPFRAEGALGKIVGGWQLSGIFSRQSGVPFSVQTIQRPDHRRSPVRMDFLRADLVGTDRNPTKGTFAGCPEFAGTPADAFVGAKLGRPNLFFDPCAFAQPQPGFFGNLGKNTLVGPGLTTLDFSLLKNTSLTERINLQFRAEFFNIANTPNFESPSFGFGGRGGRVAFDRSGRPARTVGRIDRTVTSARQIQFGLKLVF